MAASTARKLPVANLPVASLQAPERATRRQGVGFDQAGQIFPAITPQSR